MTLRGGEEVEAGVVVAPDPAWAAAIGPMLQHKGAPWTWQIERVLTQNLGVDVFFYLLHRAGLPFANIMTVERHGVGIFGHVWTDPADRRQGASSQLMTLQMADFQARGGAALYLGTRYDSPAYRMYAKQGFAGIEPASGCMAYVGVGGAKVLDGWFAPASVAVEPLDWRHWPLLQPLCLSAAPEMVRSAATHLYGRDIAEGPGLTLIRANEDAAAEGKPPAAVVLVNTTTGAVLGLASAVPHPLWPQARLVDLFCHQDFWPHGEAMLAELRLANELQIAYADDAAMVQQQAYANLGFVQTATVARPLSWTPGGAGPSSNLLVYERS